MKGLMKNALAGVALAGGLSACGCETFQKCVDPCWPERYNATARREVISAFAPQVQNGHILDQTVYNNQFDAGTDRLTAAGMDQLDGLARRRPVPDPRIFLATARDVVYDPANPDAYRTTQFELNNKRSAAVQKYMAVQTGERPMQFEIVVHDPMLVGEHADPANRSIRLNHNATAGSLSSSTSSTASSTGAGSGTGGTTAGAGVAVTPGK